MKTSIYCKPVSFEEAVEIVERAVHNGAKRMEVPVTRGAAPAPCMYTWDGPDAWGVTEGETNCVDLPLANEGSVVPMKDIRAMWPHPEYDQKFEKAAAEAAKKQAPDYMNQLAAAPESAPHKLPSMLTIKFADPRRGDSAAEGTYQHVALHGRYDVYYICEDQSTEWTFNGATVVYIEADAITLSSEEQGEVVIDLTKRCHLFIPTMPATDDHEATTFHEIEPAAAPAGLPPIIDAEMLHWSILSAGVPFDVWDRGIKIKSNCTLLYQNSQIIAFSTDTDTLTDDEDYLVFNENLVFCKHVSDRQRRQDELLALWVRKAIGGSHDGLGPMLSVEAMIKFIMDHIDD